MKGTLILKQLTLSLTLPIMVSLLLTLNMFHILILCFNCWPEQEIAVRDFIHTLYNYCFLVNLENRKI